MKTVFLDVETTGLDPMIHEMISISWIYEKQLVSFKLLPQTSTPVDDAAVAVNGYNREAWVAAQACDISAIADVLYLVLNEADVVGYNVGFDISFVTEAFKRLGRTAPQMRGIDVLPMVRDHLIHRMIPDHKLGTVARVMGVPLDNAHDSAADVVATRQIYIILWRKAQRAKAIDFKIQELWR